MTVAGLCLAARLIFGEVRGALFARRCRTLGRLNKSLEEGNRTTSCFVRCKYTLLPTPRAFCALAPAGFRETNIQATVSPKFVVVDAAHGQCCVSLPFATTNGNFHRANTNLPVRTMSTNGHHGHLSSFEAKGRGFAIPQNKRGRPRRLGTCKPSCRSLWIGKHDSRTPAV